jgi:four helix bundle protein
MRDFRKLDVWEKSHQLTLHIYAVTNSFAREEQYGLTSQIRRAATSIPSNIAEGCGRDGDAELARFLRIALGSASELEYQLLLAKDLAYLSDSSHDELTHDVIEVKRMLGGLIHRLTLKADG